MEELDNQIEMWSVQAQIVLDTLKKDGVYYVKKSYLDQKYQETAWSFKTAYQFLGKQMEKKVPRPEGAESPVWMFRDRRWAVPQAGARLLRLMIPREELFLFDLRKWNRILRLDYLGPDGEAFQRELARQGIGDVSEVFEKPFYPLLKRRILKSWEGQLTSEGLTEEETQGASWLLRKEWIMEIS